MKLLTGNLWDEIGRAGLILVTTNGCITESECLVMGAGAALEAKKGYPGLPGLLGRRIMLRGSLHDQRDRHAIYQYGCFLSGLEDRGTEMGAFQVKYHWRDKASLELIAYSVDRLRRAADHWDRIAMNMPGTGLGGLQREDVLPLLAPLPDHVLIYERGGGDAGPARDYRDRGRAGGARGLASGLPACGA